ncbi:Uncharacterised protein [Raoultella ornithinolytica]|nr:Uncharacterised protein [Raoultella ornithinolytica]
MIPTSQLMPLQDTFDICWMLPVEIWRKLLLPITGGSETSRRKAWITCRRKLAITSKSHGRNAPRGAGMAVDRAMPGQSGATYQFYGTKITTQAQNVEQLTSDIKKHGDNRVMLLAGYSGQ